MTVAVDNTGQSGGGTSVSAVTIASFAVGAGAERCIYLGVSQWSVTDRVPSATFNTTENFVVHDTVTQVEGTGTQRVTILKLVAPSNVTGSIVVSWGGAVNEAIIGADSWTNVDQTTPFGTAVKAVSGVAVTTSSVVVPNAVGDVVHDTLAADASPSVSATGNQTARWRALSSSSGSEGDGQSAPGTGSNITCTWSTLNGGSPSFAGQIGVAIKASAAVSIPVYQSPMAAQQRRG